MRLGTFLAKWLCLDREQGEEKGRLESTEPVEGGKYKYWDAYKGEPSEGQDDPFPLSGKRLNLPNSELARAGRNRCFVTRSLFRA